MTEVLTVSGNLEGLKVRLERIKEVITRRKVEGYPLWHPAERWQYYTLHDGRVCFVCSSHDGKVYRGDEVKILFPAVEYLGQYRAHPRTHDTPGFPTYIRRRADAPHGCGCTLRLLNPAEAFEAQLYKEKLGVI